VPREPLDALENLPKAASCQVAFGELQGEVPGMSDEPRAGLEEPLLEARKGPALEGDGQDQPAQQIAEVRLIRLTPNRTTCCGWLAHGRRQVRAGTETQPWLYADG